MSNTASESQRAAKERGWAGLFGKDGCVACRLPKQAEAVSYHVSLSDHCSRFSTCPPTRPDVFFF